MFKKANPFFIKVVTPLHAGSGDDLGIVDLPIQRERHTSFPKIEGSSLKGAIRESFEEKISKDKTFFTNEDDKEIKQLSDFLKSKTENLTATEFNDCLNLAFGPEKTGDHAGALGFTDARLLLFPVKSVKGVFAYITCPSVLKRFKEDLKMCDFTCEINESALSVDDGQSIITKCNINKIDNNGNILLEEYSFEVQKEEKDIFKDIDSKIDLEWEKIKKRLIILSDDDFKDFVNLSTEVITRTKISAETGTVASGALWTEEYLPTETVLYSLAMTNPIFNEDKGLFESEDNKEEERVMEFFENGTPDVLQIGGNSTIGKGICRIITFDKGEE